MLSFYQRKKMLSDVDVSMVPFIVERLADLKLARTVLNLCCATFCS